MMRTVLAAALLAAVSMPALAEDAIKTDEASTKVHVDPVTTSATTPAGQSDIEATSGANSGCMHRKTVLNMM